jgi:hypothetical protein
MPTRTGDAYGSYLFLRWIINGDSNFSSASNTEFFPHMDTVYTADYRYHEFMYIGSQLNNVDISTQFASQWFRFTVGANAPYHIQKTVAGASIRIWDAATYEANVRSPGATVYNDDVRSSLHNGGVAVLTTGIYYMSVTRETGSTLTTNLYIEKLEDFATPLTLGAQSSTKEYVHIGPQTPNGIPVRWYKFTLTSTQNVSVTLSALESYLACSIYSATDFSTPLLELETDINFGQIDGEGNVELGAGIYFVKVRMTAGTSSGHILVA